MLTSYTSSEEENLLKNIRKNTERSSAAWKYRWLTYVLIPLQVVRTPSLGSAPCEFSSPPPLPLRMLPKSPQRNSSSTEELY